MKQSFVLIFRQGQRRLSPSEQTARTAEVREWALQRLKEDLSFVPFVLADDSIHLPDGSKTSGEVVIAINFLAANDFQEAIEIARTHLDLNYGARSEFARGQIRGRRVLLVAAVSARP